MDLGDVYLPESQVKNFLLAQFAETYVETVI